jgi:hypothetical protein
VYGVWRGEQARTLNIAPRTGIGEAYCLRRCDWQAGAKKWLARQ